MERDGPSAAAFLLKAILLWRTNKEADPRHLPVLGAAPVQDCPLQGDSAASFSSGVNPSAMSLLNLPAGKGLKNDGFLQHCTLPASSFSLQTRLSCSRDYSSFK